jgi:thiamine-phosphate pyrophosphorylase
MTEHRCRLFLVAPAGTNPDHLAACLESALSCGDIACLRLPPEPATVERLMPIAQAADIAVVIFADAPMARQYNADGVQLDGDLAVYEAARAIVGPDRIVGINASSLRHHAMQVAEAGADFVAIDQSATMDDGETVITWWAEVMQVPCVTQHPCTPDEITALAAAGVDFVRPLDAMWDSPEAARDVTAEALAAVAGAGS